MNAATSPPDPRAVARDWRVRVAPWVALCVVVAGVALVRWRLVDVPLERDEGEYAYAGQLWLQGLWPYEHVYNMKLPGIYAAYAGMLALFGQTAAGIHTGLLCIHAATSLCVFLLARRLFGGGAAVAAAATFGVLALGRGVQGLFANAEHFVLLPAVLGLWLLARALQDQRRADLVAAGLALGFAFLVKQHAALFLVFGGLAVLASTWRHAGFGAALARTALFGAAVLVPYALTCAAFAAHGTFGDFWFWTFEYARAYAEQTPIQHVPETLRVQLLPALIEGWPLWLSAGLGYASLTRPVPAEPRSARAFALGFLLASFLATCPGFFFRPHYFVLVLPALALGVGALVSRLARLRHGVQLASGVVALAAVVVLWRERQVLFSMTPTEVARATYYLNPFPEAVDAAGWIAENSQPTDEVAVFGSEPEIPFYANRRSPTGFVYTYALMETHQYALEMQQRWIREIGDAQPRYVVVVKNPLSWLERADSHRLLFRWFEDFRAGYTLRAVWDTDAQGVTRARSGDALAERTGNFAVSLEVWERES